MSISAILQAGKYLPASLMVQMLGKFNPKLKNYFTEAASYGYDTTRALEYLTDRFSNPEAENFDMQLEEGAKNQTLRPDEMQIRQQREKEKIPGKIANAAIGFGSAALLGSNDETDVKAASPELKAQADKVSQARESMLQQPMRSAVSAGQNLSQGAGSQVRQALGKQSVQAAQMQSGANKPSSSPIATLIAQFPELGKYLDERIQAGDEPTLAAMQAKSQKRFQPMIAKIENDIGQNFVDLIDQLFFGFGEKQDLKKQSSMNKSSVLIEGLQMLKQMQAKLKG